MSAGRPTKYTPEAQAAADAYVSGGFQNVGDVVPSVAGMACELDVARSTLYLWADTHPDFSDTLRRCEQVQERIALNRGLVGEFNSAITKLLLANHGYSEKQALEHTSPDGSMTPTVIERHIVKAQDSDC
jgi:hypothetical protein